MAADQNQLLNVSQQVQDMSYDVDAHEASGSFAGNEKSGKLHKVHRILDHAKWVTEEMDRLIYDEVPTTLLVKMAEYIAIIHKLRIEFISATFIAKKDWEKKKIKMLIEMLWKFLKYILNDNREKIL